MEQPEKKEDIDDFPVYANEENKKLNQIIKEKTAFLNDVNIKIEGSSERFKVLNDHHASVEQELKHTEEQKRMKEQELKDEDHMKMVAERQIGRMLNDFKNMDERESELQDRLNNIQASICNANSRMDQYKLEMNWNQEELEQWALAARQKEEDNLTLEKYKRADESKIKDLNLTIQKLTTEVEEKHKELEKEVTETQAAQIELDKTAEEFKRLHNERHQLYIQFEDCLKTFNKRNQQIEEESKMMMQLREEKANKEKELIKKKESVQEIIKENKNLEVRVNGLLRMLEAKRQEKREKSEELSNLANGLQIESNQLAAFATEQSNRRGELTSLNKALEEKIKKKQDIERKKEFFEESRKKEKNNENVMASNQKFYEDEYKDTAATMAETEKLMESRKADYYKKSKELLKLRETQATLIGEISSTLSARKNIDSKIRALSQRIEKQSETIYGIDFQIQKLNRDYDKARGVRSDEESEKLKKEIKILEDEKSKLVEEFKLLSDQIKILDDDKRSKDRDIAKMEEDSDKINTQIEELKLANEMTLLEQQKESKKKESTLLAHDIMKLEIKKIKDIVSSEADNLYEQENKKSQLQMSMEEREKEIQVHKDVLLSELKAAEEERHKVAVELQGNTNKVKNLKVKYESLVDRNKATSEDAENITEHSQAYYVIKAAQEKEELQRYGDDLDGKIKKCEKELKALANTLDHLKKRNNKYKASITSNISEDDVEQKSILEDQCRSASQDLFNKRKELQKLTKEEEDCAARMSEIRTKEESLAHIVGSIENEQKKLEKDLSEQNAKQDRAIKSVKSAEQSIKRELSDGLKNEIANEEKRLKQARLLNCIRVILNSFPEYTEYFDTALTAKGIKIPSRPPSVAHTEKSETMSQKSSKII